jgi:hypothetical protein
MRSLSLSLLFPTIAYQRVCWGGGLIHYQRRPGDALQRPLRSRFRARLTPGVDMTSNVKSWLPILLHFLRPLVLRASEEAEPVRDDG